MNGVTRTQLKNVFAELREGRLEGAAAEPQSETRFKSKIGRVEHNLQTRLDRRGTWGKIGGSIATVIGYATLTLPIYWAIKGKYTQYVNPVTINGDRDPEDPFISQVTKSQWKSLSRFSKGSEETHLDPAKDRILRSSAMKLINNREDAQGLRALLAQCTTRQLCQLARGIGKEETVKVPVEPAASEAIPDAAAGGGEREMVDKLSWSPAVFEKLRMIQRDMKTPLLDEPILQTFANYEAHRDEALNRVQFHQPDQVNPVGEVEHQEAPGQAAALVPDFRVPMQAPELKSLRALGAELVLPTNLARAAPLLQGGDKGVAALRQVLLEHKEALALLCARPDGGAAAELPEGLGAALRQALALPGPLDTDPPPTPAQWQEHLASVQLAIEGLDNHQEQQLRQAVNEVVDQFDFSPYSRQLQSIETGMRGPVKAFFTEVFSRYFSEQPQEDRRNMVASLLRQSVPGDSPEHRLVAVLKGAGPFMHKVLQLFCDKVPDESTKAALSSVKTGLTPIDRELKRAMLDRIVQDSKGGIEALSEVRTLGAASVGEALLAKVKVPPGADGQAVDKSVVIKLLRPGIVERAQRERVFFAEAASHHRGMGQTFAGMADQIEAEMNLQTEAKNVQRGQVYNGQAANLEAMKLSELVPAQHDYMVVEQASGSALQHYIDMCEKTARGERSIPAAEALAYGQKAAQQLAELGRVWMSQALTGDGFFHGDLHAGNVMFQGGSGLLTVIDFGNAAAIDPKQRQTLVRLGMTLQQGHPRLFEKEFRRLLGPQAESRSWEWKGKLVEQIRSVMRDGTLEIPEKLAKILEFYNGLGIEVPAIVSNFSRSMLMLQETLGRLNAANRSNYARNDPANAELFQRRDAIRAQLDADLTQPAKVSLQHQLDAIDKRLADFGPEPVSLRDAFTQAIRPHALKLAWRAGLGFSARVAKKGVEELDAKGLRILELQKKIEDVNIAIEACEKADDFRRVLTSQREDLQKELDGLQAQGQQPAGAAPSDARLGQYQSQAQALGDKLVPLRQPGAASGERRAAILELIQLRQALKKDYPNLSTFEMKQSATRLQFAAEADIEALIQVECQDLDEAMDKATQDRLGGEGSALKVLQSLKSLHDEVTSLGQLKDQTDYPIAAQTLVSALDNKAKQLEKEFIQIQITRKISPQGALRQAGAPNKLVGAQDIAQSQGLLAELTRERRRGLLAGHAQALSMAQGPKRWDEQTAAIEAMVESVLAQIEQRHSESQAELERVCEGLRPDMDDEESLRRLDEAKAAWIKDLNSDRDGLRASVRELAHDRLGPPQPALSEHLARAQWADAAPLLSAQQPTPGDLAELALALKLNTQADELARFMHATVPNEPRSRVEFLTQVWPRDAQASAPSGPYLACMTALEQLDEGASKPMLGALVRAAGQHNPGTPTLAGGADGQVLRLDDGKNTQSLGSARQAMVTVASPKVELQSADLSQSVLHIEYRREHIDNGYKSPQAWTPSLAGARLDGARIVLDLSDLPTRVRTNNQRVELAFNPSNNVLRLFGFANSLADWELDKQNEYIKDNPDFDFESDEFPEAVRQEIAAGPPVQPGLYSILSSIPTDYPQQRKEVACQLLDLALQVPSGTMESERLLERSPLFQVIRQDAALMEDADVAQRMRRLGA